MKTVGQNDLLSRLLPPTGDVVISVSDYEFLRDWEYEIFGEICTQDPIRRFAFIADVSTGEMGWKGYFRLLATTPEKTVERLSRFMSVRLFVSSPREGFFDDIPPVVQEAVFHRGNELDEAILAAASSMSGFKWMALRDGDEGDAYYYLFE